MLLILNLLVYKFVSKTLKTKTTCMMQKEKGEWFIAFIQSTPISPDGYAFQ
jgi:hypothetical protein